MPNKYSGMTPQQIADKVEADLQAAREQMVRKKLAGTLDVSASDGEKLIALIRELDRVTCESGHARPRLDIEVELTIQFHAKPGKSPVSFSLPGHTVLIKHTSVYVLTDQQNNRQVRLKRDGAVYRFTGSSGFNITYARAKRRMSHGTRVMSRTGMQ